MDMRNIIFTPRLVNVITVLENLVKTLECTVEQLDFSRFLFLERRYVGGNELAETVQLIGRFYKS